MPVEKKYKRKIAKYQNGTRRDRIAMKGEESANKMINKKNKQREKKIAPCL